MKPFKFFFGLAVGVIVFLFLARVLFTAVIIAAILSIMYYIFRATVNFFRRLNWEPRYDNAPQMAETRNHYLASSLEGSHYNPYQQNYENRAATIIKIA